MFLVANRRERFRASLNRSKARAKLRRRLAHFPDLDERFRPPVPALHAEEEHDWILSKLEGSLGVAVVLPGVREP